MSYTVQDLIDALGNMDSEAEVRIADAGCISSFEYGVDDVVQVGDTSEPPDYNNYSDDEDEEYERDYDEWEDSKTEAVVYIGQGSQIGYLPDEARVELGW